jgi:hypothetical protein
MNRLFVPIALACLIVAGSFCLNYSDKVDRANVEFQHAKLITEQAQESLLARHKMLESRNKVESANLAKRQRLREAEARFASAEQQKLDIIRRRQKLENELNRLVINLAEVMNETKQREQGSTLDFIQLRNGKRLAQTRIRKIDDTAVSIIHADGISSVPPAELPDELCRRLGLDGVTTLNALKKLEASLSPP